MDDDHSVTVTWTGPKRTWNEQDWINYRNAPWWLQRMIDVVAMIAGIANRTDKRDAKEARQDEQSHR